MHPISQDTLLQKSGFFVCKGYNIYNVDSLSRAMSRRPDRPFTMGGSDRFDPFAVYDNAYQQSFPRASGSSSHFDSVAFWYRSEQQEPVFEPNKMLYHQNMPMASSPIEQPMTIKHRRTRSGCFTCRHRRVKCDETRPICERCKKGNRDCQFPQPSSSSRRVDSSESRNSYGKGTSTDTTNEVPRTLPTIDDEHEEAREGSMSSGSGSLRPELSTRQVPPFKLSDSKRRFQKRVKAKEIKDEEYDSSSSTKTTSPFTHSEITRSVSVTPLVTQTPMVDVSRWEHLHPTMQRDLLYHHESITHYHYFLKLDPNDFIHNELIDMALSFEPLLHAVVGFAAYHRTVGKSDGRFQEFWKHYCQSIMLLRKWLEGHTERNEAALLTILQLATFEEYLGDWASLSSHQRAAHSIFSTLYTYDNIMATETSRCIFDWLARGDLAVSIMGGAPTILERQWFIAALDWYQGQEDSEDPDPKITLASLVAKLLVIGHDVASVHADAASNPNALKDIQAVTYRLDDLRLEIQALHESAKSLRIKIRTHSGDSVSESGFDRHTALFHGDLWPLNFLWIDWYATEQIHKYQAALFLQAVKAQVQQRPHSAKNTTAHRNLNFQNLPPELEKLSLIQCRLFEAVESSPYAPSGALLGCQKSLALASVFLKKTPRYTLWARRKLATIELMGYIWPPTFRKRMSQLWNDEKVLEWWIPDDKRKTELLDEIREVAEERNKEIEGRGGDERDDVRDMKAFFDRMDFGTGGPRPRKDSVWSVTGPEIDAGAGAGGRSSSAEESDDSGEYGSGEEEGKESSTNRPSSRDSAIDSVSTTSTRLNQPVLEYSNRMSGVWEGPHNAGQKLM